MIKVGDVYRWMGNSGSLWTHNNLYVVMETNITNDLIGISNDTVFIKQSVVYLSDIIDDNKWIPERSADLLRGQGTFAIEYNAKYLCDCGSNRSHSVFCPEHPGNKNG